MLMRSRYRRQGATPACRGRLHERDLQGESDRAPSVEVGFLSRVSLLRLRPGAPPAPGGDRLRLLPSGPDLFHGPSSPWDRAISTTIGAPTQGLHPSRGNSAPLKRI